MMEYYKRIIKWFWKVLVLLFWKERMCIILFLLLTGCIVRVDLKDITPPSPPLPPPMVEEEPLTEDERIAQSLGTEAHFVWEAFQRATLSAKWKDKFSIASDIKKFYSSTKNPTRFKLYEYLKQELGGHTEIRKTPIYTKPLFGFQETWWNLTRLYFIWLVKPWTIQDYYEAYTTKIEYIRVGGPYHEKDIQKLLDEVENHYKLLEGL